MLAALFLSYAAPEAGPCGRSIGNVCSASIADRNRWSAACLSPMTRKPTSRGSTAQALASFRTSSEGGHHVRTRRFTSIERAKGHVGQGQANWTDAKNGRGSGRGKGGEAV